MLGAWPENGLGLGRRSASTACPKLVPVASIVLPSTMPTSATPNPPGQRSFGLRVWSGFANPLHAIGSRLEQEMYEEIFDHVPSHDGIAHPACCACPAQ